MKCVSPYNHNFAIYRWGWREGEQHQNKLPVKIFDLNLSHMIFLKLWTFPNCCVVLWAHLLISGCLKPCFLLPGISSGHVALWQLQLKEKLLVTSSSGNCDQVDDSGEPAPENQLISDSTRCGTGSSWFCSTSFQLFQGQEGINIPDKVLKQNVTLNIKCPP